MRSIVHRKLLALLGTAILVAAVTNAVSPRGIPWRDPFGQGLRARAALAGLVPVDLEAVRALLKNPEMIVLDSRPRDEFGFGRLPGARSLPWADVEGGRGTPLSKEHPILVYCANEFCESSLRLGEWLRSKGYRDVALFIDGYEAWWNAKGPVDQD